MTMYKNKSGDGFPSANKLMIRPITSPAGKSMTVNSAGGFFGAKSREELKKSEPEIHAHHRSKKMREIMIALRNAKNR